MRSCICVFLVTLVAAIVPANLAQAQTPATGSVVISGSLLGPVYPCGSRSCPTYDSGQIAVNVGGFTASTTYGHTGNMRAEQLAATLVSQLNASNSPVTAVRTFQKITLTSKQTGTTANYPLVAAVSHTTLFATPSFVASASGLSLSGGSGSSSGGGTGGTGGNGGSGGSGGRSRRRVWAVR